MKNLFKNRGFAFKLSMYITSCVILIFMAVLSYNYKVSKNAILLNIEENTNNLANSSINKVESALLTAQQIPEDLSFILEYTDFTDTELLGMLKNVVKNAPEIYGSGIIFEPYMFYKDRKAFAPYYYKSDNKLHYVELSQSYDYFTKDWYTMPKKLGRGVWSEPYYDEGGGNILMVTYSQPVYKTIDGKRSFIGIVGCDVSLKWLAQYISKIKIYESGYVFLLSKKGVYIVHKNHPLYSMKESIFSITEKYRDENMKILGQKMTRGESGFEKYRSISLEKPCYIRYAPMPGTGWSLAIVVPEDELFSELRTVTAKLFVMGLFGYVLTLIFIMILAHKVTTPLRSLAKATTDIGSGDLRTTIPMINSHDEIGALSKSFRTMQENLIKYINNLQTTTAAKEKIEQELSIAKEIQQSILPQDFPRLKEIDLFSVLYPAREVGGDLYDFFFLDSNHLCFAIGDVSGKGVPSSLFMAVTKTMLRAKMTSVQDPAAVLTDMNDEIYKDNRSFMFITFFLGILNIKTGELSYSNAGHNPPLIHTAGKGFTFFEDSERPPLGFAGGVKYISGSIQLRPEDILFLYTDGITEAIDLKNEEFTEERLVKVLSINKDENAVTIAGKVKNAVDDFAKDAPQADDITMLVLKYNGNISI